MTEGALSIEVTEVLRPATSNFGILPAEEESFHQSIMLKAQQQFEKSYGLLLRVTVYFSPSRGQKQDRRQLIESLVTCVASNHTRANPAAVVEQPDLPEGFEHILITSEPGEWWCGEGGGITLAEIPMELANKIEAKNKLVSRYRENLPIGAQIWLLCSADQR